MTDDIAVQVGVQLRALRDARGLSLSEVARRAQVGKGTLSELETGRRNPTLDTLFAITTALEVPLSAALPAPSSVGPHVSGDAVDAWLVERRDGAGGSTEVLRLQVRSGRTQRSAAHAAGVTEQVLVVDGVLVLGAESDPVRVGAGEVLTYSGDRPHVFTAEGGRDASAVLVMRYPGQ